MYTDYGLASHTKQLSWIGDRLHDTLETFFSRVLRFNAIEFPLNNTYFYTLPPDSFPVTSIKLTYVYKTFGYHRAIEHRANRRRLRCETDSVGYRKRFIAMTLTNWSLEACRGYSIAVTVTSFIGICLCISITSIDFHVSLQSIISILTCFG